MTPQERALVADLFDRLAKLESEPRDPEAEQLIRDGLARAPHALYPLVQTVLLQDEALKQAEARIQAMEDGGAQQPRGSGSFLDTMRDTFLGRSDERRGSVPNVRPGGSPFGVPPGYRADMSPQGAPPQAAQPQAGGGGSFLGTAAAAAAGMVGGSLLMNSLGGMFGHHNSGAASAAGLDSGSRSPWDGGNANSDLARDAGLNDIGRSSSADAGGDTRSAGLFDTASNDDSNVDDLGGDFDIGGDTDVG
jgi:hypothetical protein